MNNLSSASLIILLLGIIKDTLFVLLIALDGNVMAALWGVIKVSLAQLSSNMNEAVHQIQWKIMSSSTSLCIVAIANMISDISSLQIQFTAQNSNLTQTG